MHSFVLLVIFVVEQNRQLARDLLIAGLSSALSLACPLCGSVLYVRRVGSLVYADCTSIDCLFMQRVSTNNVRPPEVRDLGKKKPKPKKSNQGHRWRGASGGCRVAGCAGKHKGNGLCGFHIARWYKAGKPDVEQWIAQGAGGPKLSPHEVALRAHAARRSEVA